RQRRELLICEQFHVRRRIDHVQVTSHRWAPSLEQLRFLLVLVFCFSLAGFLRLERLERNRAIGLLRQNLDFLLRLFQLLTAKPHEPGAFQKLEEAEKKIRSEEHTSELQSRGHLVCHLLLEKK